MSELQTRCYAIIPGAAQENILLMADVEGNPILPTFTTGQRVFWQDTTFINRTVRETFGFDAAVVRCLKTHKFPDRNIQIRVYLMENRTPDWEPSEGAGWVSQQEIASLNLDADANSAIDLYYEMFRKPTRIPWYRPGWFANASKWIFAELNRHGFIQDSDYEKIEVEQIRSWERSTLYRIETANGQFYFKAVPKLFSGEPELTSWLAENFPSRFPRFLSIEPDLGFMLMHSFGNATLADIRDQARVVEAIRQFGKLQVALSKHLDTIQSEMGCPDFRFEGANKRINALMEDTAAMLPDSEDGLTLSEITRLRSLVPRLKEMAIELVESGLPETLDHGDLTLDQIGISGENFVFFDWSDATLSHPFFSFCSIADYLDEDFPLEVIPDLYSKMKNAYLSAWKYIAPTDQLAHALELARPLAALHAATVYHTLILPGMEVKWEMERMLPFYLKKLLSLMPEQ